MNAEIRMSASEFDSALFEKIKQLLSGKSNLEVTISISEKQPSSTGKESKEVYFSRLDKAIQNKKEGNVVSFTTEEFEDFTKHLLNEP